MSSHFKVLLVLLSLQCFDTYILSANLTAYYVEQCMAKIVEVIQPCSQRAIINWNLNHSLFVPSRMSTCCANWEVYECFIQASLENCSLLEFQAVVFNMTTDALILQKNNCSRYKYHSDMCTGFNTATNLLTTAHYHYLLAGFFLNLFSLLYWTI